MVEVMRRGGFEIGDFPIGPKMVFELTTTKLSIYDSSAYHSNSKA